MNPSHRAVHYTKKAGVTAGIQLIKKILIMIIMQWTNRQDELERKEYDITSTLPLVSTSRYDTCIGMKSICSSSMYLGFPKVQQNVFIWISAFAECFLRTRNTGSRLTMTLYSINGYRKWMGDFRWCQESNGCLREWLQVLNLIPHTLFKLLSPRIS